MYDDTNAIQGKLPTNKFMGSSDGADDDGTLNTIDTNAARLTAVRAAVLTDWINGERLDLLLDAIKVPTDKLTFTTANKVDSRVDNVAGTAQTAGDLAALITTLDTVADAIKVVTDKFAFTVANDVDCNVQTLSGSTEGVAGLGKSAGTIVTGAAEAGTLSTTEMTTDLTEATNDHYNGRIVIWTSGVLKNQASDITDYVGATGKLTYTAVTEAPSAADTFVIV